MAHRVNCQAVHAAPVASVSLQLGSHLVGVVDPARWGCVLFIFYRIQHTLPEAEPELPKPVVEDCLHLGSLCNCSGCEANAQPNEVFFSR